MEPMRSLPKLILATFVWLTAGMTLVAGTPYWQCRCADQGRPSGCCCEPAAPQAVASPIKSCCHAKAARPAPSRRLQAPATGSPCVRALAPHASLVVERLARLDVTGQEVQWLPAELPMLPQADEAIRLSAAGSGHTLAPPFDRVLRFEHFLI